MFPRAVAGVALGAAIAMAPIYGNGAAWAEQPAPPPSATAPAAAPAAPGSAAPSPAAPGSAAPSPAAPGPVAPSPAAPGSTAPGSAAPSPGAPAAPAPAAPPAASAAPSPAAPPHGAIVVAIADDAGPSARSLAHDIYRDPALRPSIDDTTARVLTGEAPAAGQGGPKLAEMAEARASVAHAGNDVVSRRLLTSLGAETGAVLVVAVTMVGGRPVARVLRTSTAAYERIELGATISTTEGGAQSYQWPGATQTLEGILTPGPRTAAPAPPPAKDEKDSKDSKPFWKSAWFWGPVGVVAAAGITVFVLSRTSSSTKKVHLDGQVVP